MTWILVVLMLSTTSDVERVASFESKEQCERAGQEINDVFTRSGKVRYVCIQGK